MTLTHCEYFRFAKKPKAVIAVKAAEAVKGHLLMK
jgi:hypothetical protein